MNKNEIIKLLNINKRIIKIGIILLSLLTLLFIFYYVINAKPKAFLFLGILILGNLSSILFYIFWRCPECKAFLGGSFGIINCPKCKCSFIDESPLPSYQIPETSNEKQNSIYKSTEVFEEYPDKFPNYAEYDIYNLVEVYKRINHHRSKKRVSVIEEQIRNKLNIDPLVSLSNPEIELLFTDILKNKKPLSPDEEENQDISKIFDRIQLFFIIVAIVMLILFKAGYTNEIIMKLGFGLFAISFLSNFIASFYSKSVYSIWRQTFSYNEKPGLFRLNQIIVFFFFLILAIVFIRSL